MLVVAMLTLGGLYLCRGRGGGVTSYNNWVGQGGA